MIERTPLIDFQEVGHIYTVKETGRRPLSVSRFFEQFKEPFDAQKISWYTARKQLRADIAEGETWNKEIHREPSMEAIEARQKILLAEWDKKASDSHVHGDSIHNPAEQIMLGNEVDPKYDLLKMWLKARFGHYYKWIPEMILYSEIYGLCGTADIALMRQRSAKSHIDIFDYKTNISKGIVFDSTKLQDSGKLKHYNRRFIGPISHLEDCNYNEYALKISLYAYMIEEMFGMPIGRLGIIFVGEDCIGDDLPERMFKFEEIPLPYMKGDVMAMLEHHAINNPKKFEYDLDDL